MRGVAAGLVAILAACAQQPGSTVATHHSVLTASTPGWRITRLLPDIAVGGLWAGGVRDAWLAGDACADQATCGDDTGNGTIVIRHWDGASWPGGRAAQGVRQHPARPGRRTGHGDLGGERLDRRLPRQGVC